MWTTPTRCPQSHEAEQNQKKRTYEVLPKPDNLIRYRQTFFARVFSARSASWRKGGTTKAGHWSRRDVRLSRIRRESRSWARGARRWSALADASGVLI